jgi:hypothetical protein
MNAIKRSEVVKRDQVSIWLFVTEVSIARATLVGKFGLPTVLFEVDDCFF